MQIDYIAIIYFNGNWLLLYLYTVPRFFNPNKLNLQISETDKSLIINILK